jgi:hypothetical protein
VALARRVAQLRVRLGTALERQVFLLRRDPLGREELGDDPLCLVDATMAMGAMRVHLGDIAAGRAQIDEGIWQVQRKYFHSFFCIIDCNIFLSQY